VWALAQGFIFHAPFRWGVSMADYMATADDDMVCMITIEHVESVNRIDEIMAASPQSFEGIKR
jgi:2-keto-3-deoxy-L-rhamnonate aldolase RhmA